ncbi:ATP-dependent DNA helicase [Psychroserpens sp.]|uniref:ATP-dependent DNA helicase n=1 Tax=Psychroserpens sp. TaxID=2020870 RepID=UPI001B2CCD0F|nr:AAA family ATPase [Psychroserpens sp.]MBO6606295.1 AAA family ATPase [Psychroserpens sp.]MBO6632062.1 AAA family ATPase [Psychroserpens sp.]MBO6652999.1 AAA family ATPase [Psychroserpens sp.]MBO6680974.1 AAA family ATPase [Psychroserpens sp.]MBO6750070.1 AAA family ATPase [Psychroserpens sp.]
MSSSNFYKLLLHKFPFEPTQKQLVALDQLVHFIFDNAPNALYLLKGFAGTGKTSIIGTLVSNLWETKKSTVLMAPTGRAAKVISNYSNKEAFTIHKKIYFPKKDRGGGVKFVLQPNKHRNTIFIVDEASMIPDTPSDSKSFEGSSLLDDLIQYVYSGHKCKLLLIGDKAQLPPVKSDLSPALNAQQLDLNYNKRVTAIELDEVVRQSESSGILSNATRIREVLEDEFYDSFQFNINGFKDIVRLIDGHEIMDAINDAYSKHGHEETAIIVRSNKRANLYNQQIRQRILFNENELTVGDFLMVVKNNYFWIKPTSEAGFIANGDIIQVLEIFSISSLYGFRFAEVKVQMVDYPKMRPFETVLLLDTITAESPSLTYDDSNRLYQEVQKDYEDETSNYRKFLKIKGNKHFNALQVKFSYAITCHKSQGGQWHTIFVEQPYLPNGIDRDYMRWLYTAVTRAKEQLYLIGFKDEFFEE